MSTQTIETTEFDVVGLFNIAFTEQTQRHIPPGVIPQASKSTKDFPNGEDDEWWKQHGPPMVQRWVEWRQATQWNLWETPTGEPAIELELMPMFEGIPLKMFIDRTFIHPMDEPIVVDLKSGKRTPESDMQLGFYKAGLKQVFDLDVKFGGYWMARKGEMELINLTRYTPQLLTRWLKQFVKAREAGIFIPHPTALCRACSLREYCATYGGKLAEADSDHPFVGG